MYPGSEVVKICVETSAGLTESVVQTTVLAGWKIVSVWTGRVTGYELKIVEAGWIDVSMRVNVS